MKTLKTVATLCLAFGAFASLASAQDAGLGDPMQFVCPDEDAGPCMTLESHSDEDVIAATGVSTPADDMEAPGATPDSAENMADMGDMTGAAGEMTPKSSGSECTVTAPGASGTGAGAGAGLGLWALAWLLSRRTRRG
jgi:hypothetical protein